MSLKIVVYSKSACPQCESVKMILKSKSMGYPEKGSMAGLAAGITNAKSFVSCAIGRMT